MKGRKKQQVALRQPQMSEKEFLKLQSKMEYEILEAICDGDLKKLETFKFRAEGIDSRICMDKDTLVYPSISKVAYIKQITGPTVLSYAVLCERPEVVRFFLTNFPCNLGVGVNDWTPIHFAAATKDTSCLKILLEHEYTQRYINDGIESDHGVTTPLHIATMFGLYETVFLLTDPFPLIKFPPKKVKLENKIDCDKMNANGMSALHIAVKNNDWEMFQVLVAVGANQSVINKEEQSPFDLAKEMGHTKLVELMENAEMQSRKTLRDRHVKLETKEVKFYEDVIDMLDKTDKQIVQIIKKICPEQNCVLCEADLGVMCNTCGNVICHKCWSSAKHTCGIMNPETE